MASPVKAGQRVPVTLLTGFLGAGKTTLLNRLIDAPECGRVAVIVNEAGEVALDGKLVVGTTEEIVELREGCVCCTVRGDLSVAVGRLLDRRGRWFRGIKFDRILVECSGLASPGPVVQTFLLDPRLAGETRVDGVIALASAADIARQLDERAEAAEQLAYADRIVLNHVDRAKDVPGALARVRGVNPGAPVDMAVRAAVDPAPLLELGGGEPERWALAGGLDGASPSGPALAHHASAPGTASPVVLRHDGPIELEKLKFFLQFVAARKTWSLMRLKGIFRCPDLARAVVAHGVYQWLELGPGSMAPPAESVLLLIGRGLDRDELTRGWAAVTGRPVAEPSGAKAR